MRHLTTLDRFEQSDEPLPFFVPAFVHDITLARPLPAVERCRSRVTFRSKALTAPTRPLLRVESASLIDALTFSAMKRFQVRLDQTGADNAAHRLKFKRGSLRACSSKWSPSCSRATGGCRSCSRSAARSSSSAVSTSGCFACSDRQLAARWRQWLANRRRSSGVRCMRQLLANWPASAPKCSLAYARAALAVSKVSLSSFDVTIG